MRESISESSVLMQKYLLTKKINMLLHDAYPSSQAFTLLIDTVFNRRVNSVERKSDRGTKVRNTITFPIWTCKEEYCNEERGLLQRNETHKWSSLKYFFLMIPKWSPLKYFFS